MKKGIIFDMDGVLIDSERYYFERRMDYFKEKGYQPGSSAIIDYVGKTEENVWHTLVPEDDALRQQLRAEYQDYQAKHAIDFYPALRKEVPAVLAELKNRQIHIGLASSSPRSGIERMLKECDLAAYFSYVISGGELHESKPHPEIYLLSMQHLACDSYVAVEDSPLGIASAKAAGLYTVALTQEFPVDQQQADLRIDSLTKLLTLPELQA